MNEFTVADLDKAASKARRVLLKNANTNYHYARSLGFNSYEASVLRGQTLETIKRLAIEKGLIKDNGGISP